MDPFETPYTPLDVTKRKVLLKLELSGDVAKKLQAVASTVYGMNGFQPTQATDQNREWNTTDQVLYSQAKTSYDEILKTFKSEPKVYKFESVKEKIWERNKTGGGLDPPMLQIEAPPVLSPKQLAQAGLKNAPGTSPVNTKKEFWGGRHKKRAEERKPLTMEEQAYTYIDPFQTVIPKIPMTSASGQAVDRVEVWHEKLEMLKKLTPREDLEGYEIREDYADQQKRLAAQTAFQQRMRQEIQRREEQPTEIEQVEDVLFDIVEAISRNFERVEKAARVQIRTAERNVWHPAATGFKMRHLGVTESESGVVTKQVSDFLFSDFMISPTGYMLGVRAPPELFELHDQERRVKLERELRRLEAEELEKKRPLTEKLRIAVAMARNDPAAAAKKAASDVLERAIQYPRSISERLLQHSREVIARGLAGIMQSAADPQTALEDLSESLVASYRTILKRDSKADANSSADRPQSANFNSKEPSIRDVERIIAQEEEQQRQREELISALRNSTIGLEGRPMVPVVHADTVLVTVTLLVSPPPAYVMRPPPSIQRELVRTKKRVMGQLRTRAQQLKTVLQRIEESDPVQVLKKLGRGEKLAAFADANVSVATLESGRHPGTEGILMDGAAGAAESGAEIGPTEGEAHQPANAGGDDHSEVPHAHHSDSGSDGDGDGEVDGRRIRPRSGAPTPAPAPAPRLPLTASAIRQLSLGRLGARQPSGRQLQRGQSSFFHTPMAHMVNSEAPSNGVAVAGAFDDQGMFTQRSRRPSNGITATSIELELSEDRPLEHEEVHVERIRNKRDFRGHLLPEDLVPKAFKNYGGKMVFDTSVRRQFEDSLVAEVADAVSLPVKNVSIEEIRRLEIDAPRLYLLQQRKEAMIQNVLHLKREEQDRLDAERNARKAYHIALEKFEGLPADSELISNFTAQLAASSKPLVSNSLSYSALSALSLAPVASTLVLPTEFPPLTSTVTTTGPDVDVAASTVEDGLIGESATPGGCVSDGDGDEASAGADVDLITQSLPLPTLLDETCSPREPLQRSLLPEEPAAELVADDAVADGVDLSSGQLTASGGSEDLLQTTPGEDEPTAPPQDPPSPTKAKKSVTFHQHGSDAGSSHVDDGGDQVLVTNTAHTGQVESPSEPLPDVSARAVGTASISANCDESAFDDASSQDSPIIGQQLSVILEEPSTSVQSDSDATSEHSNIGVAGASAGAGAGGSKVSFDDLVVVEEEGTEDSNSFGAAESEHDEATADVDVEGGGDGDKVPPESDNSDGSEANNKRGSMSVGINEYMKSQPLQPQPFKIGVPNPDASRHDPDYWLAKSLNDLTALEKRKYRIARLKLLRKEDELKKRVKHLKQARADLIEDSIDFLAPVIERLQPVVDKLKPVVVRARSKMLKIAASCFDTLTEITKGYRGPKMVDVMQFEQVLRSVGASAKLLASSVQASATGLSAKYHYTKQPAAPAAATPKRYDSDILATMEDMIEEVEYRYIEDTVEVLLMDMCAHVEDQHARQDIAALLESMCDTIETQALLQAVVAAALDKPLPVQEEPLSEYDFDAIMRRAQKEKSGVMDRMRLLDEQSVDTAEEDHATEEGSEEEEEADEEDAESALDGDGDGSQEAEESVAEGSNDVGAESGSEEQEEADAGTAEDDAEVDGGSGSENDEQKEEEEEEGGDDEGDSDGDGDADDEEGDGPDEDGDEEDDEGSDDGSGDVEAVRKGLSSRMKKLKELDAAAAQAGDELSAVASQLQAMTSDAALALVPMQPGDADVLLEVSDLLSDMCDRVEVSVVLDDLCFAVEDRVQEEFSVFHDLSELQTSAVSVASSIVADNDLSERLVGCEVTFKIFVGAEQRQLDGLADIEAEDIAILLQQQLFDVDSPLYAGLYGKTVLDVQYKVAHKRKQFDKWESFYTHIIHPSFFGYTCKLPKPKQWSASGDGLVNGRLPSGIAPLNPTLLFNERNKATFQELNNKPVLRPPWERVKREDISDDEATVASSVTEGHVLDLNVDEFAHDVKKLKLFRPNMSALTKKDIQRLKRLHKAFEERYEEEMRKGLVDGNGLRPEQYLALKERDSAYRIYRTARQKFKHVNKHLSEELVLPPLEVTHIDTATFDGWVEEVRLDDQQRLREARAKAAKRKKILTQEALLRRNASQKRFWIIDTFIAACENPLDVGHAFEEQMLKLDIQREFVKQHSEENAPAGSQDPATEKLLLDLTEKQSTFKKLVISEEKKTRKMFEMVIKWCARQRQQEPADEFAPDALANDSPVDVVEVVDGPAVPSALDIVATESVPVQVVDDEQAAYASTPEPAASTRPGTADTTVSRRTDKTDKTAEEDGEHEAPSLPKEDLQAFLEVALRAIVEHNKALKKAERAKVKEQKQLESQRRMESLQAFHGRGKPVPAALTVDTAAAADNDGDGDSDEDADGSLLSPLLCPTPGSAASATSRFSFAAGTTAIAQLGAAEFELIKEINWLKSVKAHPQFQRCLAELPTLAPNAFARDELIQFAAVLCEVEPVFAKVLAELTAAKEASEVAMGLRKSKSMEAALIAKQQRLEKEEKRKARKQAKAAAHQQQLDAAEADAEAEERRLAEKLVEDQRKTLELVARAAEREKAWFMAHPHKFIRHPGEPAFCIVCKEKETEYWMKQHRDSEQTWREGFDAALMERVEEAEVTCKETVEMDMREHLTNLAGALVSEEMEAEERAKAEEGMSMKKISRSFKGMKLSPMKLLNAARGTSGPAGNAPAAGMTDEEEERAWPKELARIRGVILSAGLSLLDPRGRSILPKRPPKKAAIQMYVAPVLVEGEADDAAEQDKIGLRIRVWHRDAEGNRANFLGIVSFTEKEMMKPPKGMRTFPLQRDPAVVETDPTPVSGNIVVMLRAAHTEHKNGCNTHWRLEIVRANKLAGVDSTPGGGGTTVKLPNPFCEVYWKGPALRKGKLHEITEWTVVGHTATKQNTDAPQYDKESDLSLLELPPVWTEHDIPRGQFADHFQEGGGWVARNQVPVLEEGEQDEDGEEGGLEGGVSSKGGSTKRDAGKRFPFGAKSAEEVVQFRKIVKYNELVSKEVQLRLERLKYILNAEERERKCMAQEERQQRSSELANEISRSSVLVSKQTEYSRAFMRLLHLVQSPPNILARLRFLMGEESKGGGQKVMCEDPATGKVFNVISTPILRKADEEFILAQMNSLFGITCPNLVHIVDFSIHQLRDFNDKGFSSVDERMAIAVLDFTEGSTVMQYLHKHWETLTNDAFREMLCQIMNAIHCMHQAGILHRNIHPEAITVELPNSRNVIKKRVGAPRSTPAVNKLSVSEKGAEDKRRRTVIKPINNSIVCHLGDYWFLHNPRAVGCGSSQGRADWGALATAPPEATSVSASAGLAGHLHALPPTTSSAPATAAVSRIGAAAARASGGQRQHEEPPVPPIKQPIAPLTNGNGSVCDKSDVYAFGVCLYYWATKGIHRALPMTSAGVVDMATAKKNIPLKWNTWVHSLLDMCLQLSPQNRASSKDIHMFLSSRFGK